MKEPCCLGTQIDLDWEAESHEASGPASLEHNEIVGPGQETLPAQPISERRLSGHGLAAECDDGRFRDDSTRMNRLVATACLEDERQDRGAVASRNCFCISNGVRSSLNPLLGAEDLVPPEVRKLKSETARRSPADPEGPAS